MAEENELRAIGLMSGTSLDGIDAALLVTDGESISQFGATHSIPYSDELYNLLWAALIAGREVV